MLRRNASDLLLSWKASPYRKPLIIRGARQVGKTTLIREFSKQYQHAILLNLEKAEDRAFFPDQESIDTILQRLLFHFQVSPDSDDILIFIDEIQESPYAIRLLRYFYEEYPAIHVIAAGSLLEFALSKLGSFPVGRVEYLQLHPINFEEFVRARHPLAYEKLMDIPLEPIAFDLLMTLFHEYALVGGMPEIVSRYLETEDLVQTDRLYRTIQRTYEEDVPRYASNASQEQVLRFLMQASPLLADRRITFQNFGNSGYRSREVGEGLRILQQAGFLYLIYPTTSTDIPPLPDLKKSPRLQYLDSGIMASKAGIRQELIGVKDLSNVFQGRLIEHLVLQQVISTMTVPGQMPTFWIREKSTSQAEVDLVIQQGALLIPVEVKSGPAGRLRSLHQFMDACDHGFAIRLLANQLGIDEVTTPAGKPFRLLNLPYFLGSRLQEYAAWFVNQS